MTDLAIVIPAYKQDYFAQALASLANQTRKDFTVYIGDDHSPYDLKGIAKSYENKLTVKYTRFPNNTGAENLVRQWRRCVDLTQGEEWIWLFSDDDLVDENCVESFYKQVALDGGTCDVYRFNNTVIDENGEVIRPTPDSPLHESSEEMAYNLLVGKRGNSMADHIFSRKIYEKSGGFVYTKYAQGADWAMSILFSKDKGLVTLPEGRFYWRYSGANISAKAHKIKSKTFVGHLQFIAWVVDHFGYLKTSPSSITYNMMVEAAKANLLNNLAHHYKGFHSGMAPKLIKLMHHKLGMPYLEVFKQLAFVKGLTDPTFKKAIDYTVNIKKRLHG